MRNRAYNPVTDIDGTPPRLWERVGYWFARRKILKSKKTKGWPFWYHAPKWLFTDKYYEKDDDRT